MKVLDCTIRDGSYVTNYNWDKKLIASLVSSLSAAGIEYIEIGNGTGLGVYRQKDSYMPDADYFNSAIPYKGNSKIGAFFIPDIGTKEDLKKFKEAGGDFVRVGVNATETQKAYEYIEYSAHLGFYVFCNLMKSYAVSRYQIVSACDAIVKAGAQCIYVVDSAGGMIPSQISSYVKSIRDFYDVAVGFHGHNNLMMANANSLAAVESGAEFVDATLGGLGRGAGNAQLESLVAVLGKAGYLPDDSIDISALSDLSNTMFSELNKNAKGSSKREIIVGCANFHDSFTGVLEKYAGKYNVDANDLLVEVSRINIVNPSEELFDTMACKLSSNTEKRMVVQKFYHKKY